MASKAEGGNHSLIHQLCTVWVPIQNRLIDCLLNEIFGGKITIDDEKKEDYIETDVESMECGNPKWK